MIKEKTHYRCKHCGYLIDFLEVKYAKFYILERCPRCGLHEFEPICWKHKEIE